jgi:hypothetical protein
VRDGPLRRAVKRVARAHYELNLGLARALLRHRGERAWTLAGECRRCARCCEAPAVRAGWLTFHLRSLRVPFLWWMRVVNGFELQERLPKERVFVFRCTHFDWRTRRCDSYDTRPGLCRDYPRLLLHQASPEFLPGCGYRAVAPNAAGLARALQRLPLAPERQAELREKLRLE